LKEKKRERVGKVSYDLLNKPLPTKNPIELERELHTEYEKNVWECVDRYKKTFPADFFVIVITKKEPLMPNVLRNMFTARLTCPTPDYDQAVYHYDSKKHSLDFLWVIPARDICHVLKYNALNVVPEERELLRYVLEFDDGTLYKLAKKLNNESDSILLVD
jgi:hypothetical protein